MVGGCTVASGYKGYWVAGHPAAVAAGTLEVLLKVRQKMLGDETEIWLVVWNMFYFSIQLGIIIPFLWVV